MKKQTIWDSQVTLSTLEHLKEAGWDKDTVEVMTLLNNLPPVIKDKYDLLIRKKETGYAVIYNDWGSDKAPLFITEGTRLPDALALMWIELRNYKIL